MAGWEGAWQGVKEHGRLGGSVAGCGCEGAWQAVRECGRV